MIPGLDLMRHAWLIALCFAIAGNAALAQTPEPARPAEGQAGKDVVWIPSPRDMVGGQGTGDRPLSRLRSALTEPLSQPLNAPAQYCGDLVFESLVTEREATIGCASDFFQIFFVQFEFKQAAVCRSPLLGCLAERDITVMRRHEG